MEKINEIQIKPPVTEEEKNTAEKDRKIEKKQSEEYFDFKVESEGQHFSRVVAKGKAYSETIRLNQEGEINKDSLSINSGRNIIERSCDFDRGSLNRMIDAIRSKFKNLNLTLEETKEELVLTVENKIKKGISVNWISQGSKRWLEPKAITNITEDGQYAFFNDSATGIPISQLEAE